MAGDNGSDPIGDAIAKAAASPAPDELRTKVNVAIESTGRIVAMDIPILTDSELLELIGWMGSTLRVAFAQERAKPRSRIEIARVLPPS